ncbi:hypothetical protein GCM10011519_31850 [Marmoricola endophyticus]|uniref:Uncharacterized protein n=1 Tax=Marmoricola endophyticus TaxID=2040280 RepID=A0A917BR34_9ACTN|nr:hypothetical protein GCM10011519_31850 [Marmoricola endophyticus]
MLLALVAGITVTIVAWGILVLAAIDFGRDARAGTGESWVLMAGATLGAVACLFLAIIFAAKLQARVKSTGPRTAVEPETASPEPSSPPLDADDTATTEVDDEGLPLPQPAPYASRHSNTVVDDDHADTEDSPAAAYRGKRAKR